MVKYSRQREGILRNLQSRRDHPTADMIYDSVRKEYPNISLGTVYRNSTFLTETGQIIKISTQMGADRYDGFIKPHNHFICRECGMVEDMEYISCDEMILQASGLFPGLIEDCELQFFGKCKKSYCFIENFIYNINCIHS